MQGWMSFYTRHSMDFDIVGQLAMRYFPKQVYPVGVLAVNQSRRTILHARFVCVFTVFERSRFTTLQRNGGYPHVCMCFISQNGPGAFQNSSGSISPANLKNEPKNTFSQNCRGPLGCHLLSSLVPKSRFRGFGKKFSRCKMTCKMMQTYPLNIFHASVWPESLPGAN